MTVDERIEALLNRAGQTISDLPSRTDGKSHTYNHGLAWDEAEKWFFSYVNDRRRKMNAIVLARYVLHLTDIIDRMETALENVIGERDWLRANYSANPNETVPEDWRADE